jgi:tetratricopeptide (TPR) repeat protein
MRAALRTGELSRAFSRAAALWERAGVPEQALYCRATAAAARRKYAAALPLYQRLAQNKNLEWKSRGLQGAAEMMRLLNRPEEYLQAARQAADGSAVSEIRIANAYLLIGDQKQREAHLRRALAKDPSTAGAVYLELAGQAENKGHKEEAIALLRQAVKSSPADAQAWLALSRLILTFGGARAAHEAVEAAAQAAAAEPQNQEAFRELGRACGASGDHLRAKQAFQHAIDLDPRNPESYELLARELRALGDNEAATDSESRARRLRLENNARRPRKTGPKS